LWIFRQRHATDDRGTALSSLLIDIPAGGLTRCGLLLLLASCLLAPSPAKAMADPCQPLSERLRSIDSAWLKYDLRNRFPDDDAKILAKIDIVQSTDENLLGPHAVEARNSIVIPPRYLQTQCHMVFLQLLWLADPKHSYGEVAEQARACITAGGPRATCLDKAIVKMIARVSFDTAVVEWNHTNVELFAMSIFAIRFQLAHEAGHLLTNARHSVKDIREIDTEWEADILATLSVVGDSPIVEAPLFAMASASLADAGENDSHGPTACRLERARAVITQLGLPALMLNSWDQKTRTFSGKPVQSSMRVLKKPYLVAPPRVDCEADSDRRLVDVKADLDSIIRAIGVHATARTLEMGDPATADANLAGFAPRTASGARLRAVLRMQLAIQRYDFGEPLIKPGSAERQADFEAYLAQLKNINDLIGPDAGSYFRSSELVAMLFQKATTEYIMHPAGSSLLQNSRQFLNALREINAVSPINEEIRVRLFEISLSPAEDANSISRLLLFRLKTQAGMAMIVGECAEANRLLLGAREASGLPPSTPITPEKCRVEGRESGRSFAVDRGWTLDLP
jgi:hypothetical protein